MLCNKYHLHQLFLYFLDTNVIKVQVQPLELNYGSDGMISCFISLNIAIGPDTSVIIVKWYHNNEQLNNSMNLQQRNASCIESIITFNNIQLEDAGDYTCNVSIGNDDYVMATQSVCVFGKFSTFFLEVIYSIILISKLFSPLRHSLILT